jgi:hypothetical protein
LEEFVRNFKKSFAQQQQQQPTQTISTGPKKGVYFSSGGLGAAKVLERILKERLNIRPNNVVDETQAQTAFYFRLVPGARVDSEFVSQVERANVPNPIIILLIPGKLPINLPDNLKNKKVFQFLLKDYWELEKPLDPDQYMMLDIIVIYASPLMINNCVQCNQPAFKQCGNCQDAIYCSQKCANTHWEKGHKDECY